MKNVHVLIRCLKFHTIHEQRLAYCLKYLTELEYLEIQLQVDKKVHSAGVSRKTQGYQGQNNFPICCDIFLRERLIFPFSANSAGKCLVR
jgi:hypothetical protein